MPELVGREGHVSEGHGKEVAWGRSWKEGERVGEGANERGMRAEGGENPPHPSHRRGVEHHYGGGKRGGGRMPTRWRPP